ncbi:TPA: hypothetical protein ACH3X1_005203 [Trebouxia sp. C0004]
MRLLTTSVYKQASSTFRRHKAVAVLPCKLEAPGTSGRSKTTDPIAVAALPQVIVLTGPTAVGKTQLSLALAQQLRGEIISADSVQVYKGLDIGSDKISVSERLGVPHHLLDILPADAEFSAGHFYEAARAAIQDILQRGRVPIVVGGTGLYLRWLVHGRPRTPKSEPVMAARAQEALDQVWAEAEQSKGFKLTDTEKWEAGTALIAKSGDPAAAERVSAETNNYYRLVRVLEIIMHTGKPLAEFEPPADAPLDYDFRCFFLQRPRLELFQRIDLRVEQMVDRGLLQEAQWMLDQGIRPDSACAGRAIGYRHALLALEHWHSHPEEATSAQLVKMVKDVQQASRQLNKRQMTWFRDDPMYLWLDAKQPVDKLVGQITSSSLAEAKHIGSCGNSGRLNKIEANLLKRYQTSLQLFNKPEGPASTRLFWRFIDAGSHPLDTVKQDSAVVSGGCLSLPSQQAPLQHVSACTVAQNITAVPAQPEASAASSVPAASNNHVGQANGMPEGVSGGQAVQNNVPKQTDASAAQEQHFQTLEQVISFFEKQDPEGFFGAPVTEDVAPNYFSVIKHPMSCQRMRQKLRALEYRTFAAFVEDFELIGNNAMRYNQKRSRVHRSAVNLLRHGKKHLNNVQLEATRAIHLLHPEGPVAAAQEEAAASRGASAVPLAPSMSNLNKLLPPLTMPHHSSKQLQRGVSGLDMSIPMALQDLQADYFSDEDPAYSSFSDTDLEDSDIEPSSAPFSPHTTHEPVVAEPWGPGAPPATTSADSDQPQQPSSTTWQTHWLELRIHALRQQQQRYESKLQRLHQQGQQPAESAPSPLPLHPQQPGGSALTSSHQPGAASTVQDSQAAANSRFPQSVASDQVTALSLPQLPSADIPHHHPGAAASFPAALYQKAAAGGEPRHKRRHPRQQMPGLSLPEIARHPFFSQHGSAEPASTAQQLASEEEGRDDCYPARVHATLDLLDRHLATMKDQLTPKPLVGRAPPKKVARGGVAVARRGKAKPGRARGLFAPPAKQVLDRSDSKLGKRRRTTDYDFGDVIMPPLPGAKAVAQLPKVCITVPGVRPLPEEELDRRMRAVELMRSGKSVSEADSELRDLVRVPSDAAAAAGASASSSDEDTSDEAFAARHAGLEAEEQHRFNSFAGEPAIALCLSASWLDVYCSCWVCRCFDSTNGQMSTSIRDGMV